MVERCDRAMRQRCLGAIILCVAALVPATGHGVEPMRGRWVGEGGVGFVANTPDDTGFALNAGFDRFVTEDVSIGPLVQFGFTNDSNQVGFTGLGKYWIDIDSDARLKVALQGGIGFVFTDYRGDDTSFLLPLGVGLYYWTTERLAVGTSFLLNLTDLDTGGGGDTNVMPGLTFGLRY